MRLPIITLLGVVAVSTVGAQDWCEEVGKFPDPDCPLTVRMAPISGNNDVKEQQAVDELAALGLLNVISQGDGNPLNENSRGGFKKILKKIKKRVKTMYKKIKKIFKPKKCCKRFFGKKNCKKCGPKRPLTTPPPYYPEEAIDYANPEPTEEQAEEPESVNVPKDPQGDFNDGVVAPENARNLPPFMGTCFFPGPC
uniref:Uncharacterized protein n=1 Tax=Panagrellus redivivus TaxID=6233 RepID=A0A7E4V7R0_PANRE